MPTFELFEGRLEEQKAHKKDIIFFNMIVMIAVISRINRS